MCDKEGNYSVQYRMIICISETDFSARTTSDSNTHGSAQSSMVQWLVISSSSLKTEEMETFTVVDIDK